MSDHFFSSKQPLRNFFWFNFCFQFPLLKTQKIELKLPKLRTSFRVFKLWKLKYYGILVNLCNCLGLVVMTYLHQVRPQHTLPMILTPFLPSHYSSLTPQTQTTFTTTTFHFTFTFLLFSHLNISSFTTKEKHLPI